jgi:antitoxin VapB
MQTERHISLFRNGRNQAIRIPREFELEGKEATIRKEGDKLIIEPIKKKGLSQVLATLSPLDKNLHDFTDDIDNNLSALDPIDL